MRIHDSEEKFSELKAFKKCTVGNDKHFLVAKVRREHLTEKFISEKASHTKSNSGTKSEFQNIVEDLRSLNLEYFSNNEKVENPEVFLFANASRYSQQEEFDSLNDNLQIAIEALIDSETSFFYSIPPQSVIQIGLSTYKGLNSSVRVCEYPLLIADLRAATNYFILKEKGAKLEHITQSPLGEGSFC